MNTAKKLLLIMEMNQTLVYINNRKTKFTDFSLQNKKVEYDQSYSHFDFAFRKGRNEFLQFMFNIHSKNIDLAIWSNLDSEMLEPLCQKYFGRYYRQLFFVLGTNRSLYTKATTERQQPLKIRKELSNVYSRFQGYTDQNTLVVSSEQNLVEKHMRNDIIVPQFTPKSPKFDTDLGAFVLKKYIQGIMITMEEKKANDVRTVTDGRQIKNLFDRYTNTIFGDKKIM